jgi:hypothetical protein
MRIAMWMVGVPLAFALVPAAVEHADNADDTFVNSPAAKGIVRRLRP